MQQSCTQLSTGPGPKPANMLYFIGLHVLVACAWLRLLHPSDAASSSDLQFALHCMMMAAEGAHLAVTDRGALCFPKARCWAVVQKVGAG